MPFAIRIMTSFANVYEISYLPTMTKKENGKYWEKWVAKRGPFTNNMKNLDSFLLESGSNSNFLLELKVLMGIMKYSQ